MKIVVFLVVAAAVYSRTQAL